MKDKILGIYKITKDLVKNILGEENKEQPWYDLYGNNVAPSLEYPKGTMVEAVFDAAKIYPKNKAYIYYGKSVTYEKFVREIKDCARSLKALGVLEGDRVTICMPNTPEAIIFFYAVNLIGAVANIIHPLSSEKEIEYYLNKSKSKYLLSIDMCYPKIANVLAKTSVQDTIIADVSNHMLKRLKLLYPLVAKKIDINYDEHIISWKNFEHLAKTYDGKIETKRGANDDAVILYSGGTTGDPKGVVLTNLNFNALGTQSFKMCDPAKAGDRVLTIMPIFHGFGLGVCVHTELISGMSVILVPQFKASEFSKLIKKTKPNFLVGVPTMYEALINSGEKKKNYLNTVTTVICGGDVLNQTLRNKVNDYLKSHGSKAVIRVGYGLTESTAASCLTPRYYFKEGGIGIPFPDTIYKIIHFDSTDECDVNEAGEICIYGPTVMKGYLDDPDETKKTLRRHPDGKVWLHTGDVGYMDEQGLIFFESRIKRMIVTSGYNVYPQYIEKVIDSHPAVLSCTVVGIPHEYKKMVPKAYIVLRKNFELTEDLKNDIKSYAAKSISKYALPYEYEYVDEIPKTLVGKVAFTKLEQTKYDIRYAKKSDLKEVLKIYEIAREKMIESGNPHQWGKNKPEKDVIISDIENNNSYVVLKNNEIVGVFALIDGIEPTYEQIEGKWINEKEYTTIHRVASDSTSKGIMNAILEFVSKDHKNLKIDTHEDNKKMQHILEKKGFKKCGIIHLDDGAARIAYQREF